MQQLAQEFEEQRAYLIGVAYRMLGSRGDAEDVVQEALIRACERQDLRSPRAFLTTVVTRLCLDELGSARRRREQYVGPFFPEPLPTSLLEAPHEDEVEHSESVSVAFLLLLERLTPLERAVFVLRELFELDFGEIAGALERSEAACRKLLQRSREKVGEGAVASEHRVPALEQTALSQAFFAAIVGGDMGRLVELLAEEVVLETDHGGKAQAARRAICGAQSVARFLHGLAQKAQREPERFFAEAAVLNGAPAFILRAHDGRVEATFTLQIARNAAGAYVERIYVMRNPDKLERLKNELRLAAKSLI